tara:strand:+ start:756 stop:1391 length:636 start_codon:yes stop_codon:yes gene_type:complete
MIFSIHLPKCAGTSLQQSISKQMDPKDVYFDYGDRITDVSKEACVHRARRVSSLFSRDDFFCKKLVHGHFYAHKYYGYFPESKYVTVMRNPIKMLPSYYDYLRRTNQDNTLTRLARSLSCFEEFCEHPWFQNIIHKQIFPLGINDFEVIGVQENYKLYLDRLSDLIGLDIRERKANTNPKPAYSNEKHVIDKIVINNSIDMELYEQALLQN